MLVGRLGWILGALVLGLPSIAGAANVALEAPAGAPVRQPGESFEVVAALLVARGHTVTIVAGDEVDTIEEIQQFDTVVLSSSGFNYGHDVPVFDAVIEEYVSNGGGMVLTGWVYYFHSPAVAPGLNTIAPFEQSQAFLQNGVIDVIDGHEITLGLSDWNNPSFDAYSGALKVGATALSSNGGTIDGGAWDYGNGRVASLGMLFMADYQAYPMQSLHDGSIPDATEMFLRAIEWTSALSAPEGCHDGILDPEEECDDGNVSNADACVNPCVFASCGDGFTFVGVEACDDGDADNGDACLDTCVAASCGDGFVRVGVEQCDDVDGDDTDECLDNCAAASCGDGFLYAGVEGCDDGNLDDTDACPGSCQAAVCGDGYVLAGVEACDDGNDNNDDDCLMGCAPPSCGDGFLQNGVEACDDGNQDDTDTCVGQSCTLASCGDGFVFAGFEECDDANATPGDGCDDCDLESDESSSDDGPSTEESTSTSSDDGSSDDDGTSTGSDSTGGSPTGDPTDADSSGDSQPSSSGPEPGSSGPSDASGDPTATGSTGDDGAAVDAPATGCGCRAATPNVGPSWAWSLMLLGLRRRRRRSNATSPAARGV